MNVINPPATHCDACGAEYQNIQHPFYPGASMMQTCDCRFETTVDDHGNSFTYRVPPTKAADPK